MIARAFRAGERAGALRWAAAGGIAVLPDPMAGGSSPAPWVAPGERGWDIAQALCWDRILLRKFTEACGVRRTMIVGRDTPAQRAPLCARPLRRAVERCGSGAVEKQFGWDEGGRELAAGKLWCGVCGKRPCEVHLEEVRQHWTGPQEGWVNYRPGWAFLGSGCAAGSDADGADLERAIVPRETLTAAALEAATVPLVTLFGGGILLGVGSRTLSGLYRAIGAAVLNGHGEWASWVARDVAALAGLVTAERYAKVVKAVFHREPDAGEMREAGYE